MFGTNLLPTRAARLYEDSDLKLIAETLGVDQVANVLYDNAREFYKLQPSNV